MLLTKTTAYYLAQMQELLIREFTFHQLNANLLWPGSFAFAEWLVQHKSWIEGKRIIELGRYVLFPAHSLYVDKRFPICILPAKKLSLQSLVSCFYAKPMHY